MVRTAAILTMVSALLVVGASNADAQMKPWAEWNFTSDFDVNDELTADKASESNSLIRLNTSGSVVYSVTSGVMTCAGSASLLEFLQLDINDMVANGGGSYVNDYTFIWDIKTDSSPDWIGLFNANPPNSNAAELWLQGNGAVGKGGNYSAPGAVPQETWTRLVATYGADGGGNIIQNLYVNGINVLADVNVGALDGSYSFYTDAQKPVYQVALFGGEDGGTMYLDDFDLQNFGIVTKELKPYEALWLGGYDATGIGLEKLQSLMADTGTLSESNGGTVNFTLDAGVGNPNRIYLMLGSITGTSPGIPLPGGADTLPLNYDIFTYLISLYTNSVIFQNFLGSLDGAGLGSAALWVAPLPAGSVGTTMYFAYCLAQPYDFASNPTGVLIGP